jgi:thiamine-monophosphate kinase
VAERSAVALRLRVDTLPLSPALERVAGARAGHLALGAGDDYELLFTAPEDAAEAVRGAAARCRLAVTAVGSAMPGRGVHLVDAAGRDLPTATAFQHFRTTVEGPW